MWTAERGRRALAWIVLGLIGVTYVWDCGHVVQFTSARLFPFDFLTWIFVWLPFLVRPLPLVGYWLLCDALWKGGGRWGWRWVCGGIVVGLFVHHLIEMFWFYSHLRGLVFDMVTDRPFVLPTLQVIAAVPIWVLRLPKARPRSEPVSRPIGQSRSVRI